MKLQMRGENSFKSNRVADFMSKFYFKVKNCELKKTVCVSDINLADSVII